MILPLLTLGACGAPHSPSDQAIATFSLTTRAGITDYAVDPDPLKHAAAGYFRDVAVAAPDESAGQFRARVATAIYSEKGVHASLGAAAQQAIVPRLAALDAAARQDDRQGAGLAALEIYRALVEDMATVSKATTAMALIDYAQLAGAARLAAARPDWSGVDAAMTMAGQHWDDIAGDVGDPALAGQMGAALKAAREGAARRDDAATEQALQAARPSIDRLIAYFKRT